MRPVARAASAAFAALAGLVAATATAHAGPSTITATPIPFTSTEQVDFSQPFIGGCSVLPPPVFQGCTAPQADCNVFGIPAARFQSSRSAAVSGDFSVTASFSDGSTGGGVVELLSAGGFTAVVEHPAFPEPASPSARVTVRDNVDGSSATVTTPIAITERVIRANGCADRTATAGTAFTGLPVAIVVDSEQGTPDVDATIAWGDGAASTGTWQPTAQYPSTALVAGSHTYVAAGRYQVTVTVVEPDDASSRMQVSTVVAVSSVVPVPATGAAAGQVGAGAALMVGGLWLVAAARGAAPRRRCRGPRRSRRSGSRRRPA